MLIILTLRMYAYAMQKDMTPRKLASTNGHAAMVKLLKEHEDKLRTGKR